MAVLELILVLFLQFEGVRGGVVHVYYRPGSDAILPCNRQFISVTSPCPLINWLYNRDPSRTISEVNNGNVEKTSARAARLSLSSTCSLIISNITADDVGRYTCRHGRTTELDTFVYLNILTVSPSPPEADPERDGYVTLECSLVKYKGLPDCRTRSIRWVNETGAELDGEEVRYKLGGQKICVSTLTVKHQSGNNRRYTCQYVEGNNVKIEAHYTPVFTDPSDPNTTIIIVVGAVVGVVTVLLVIAALLLIYRRRPKEQEDQINETIPDVQKSAYTPDDPEPGLTYVTVDHANQKAAARKKATEENVTYSAVKTPVKAEDDPGSLYCSIDKAH